MPRRILDQTIPAGMTVVLGPGRPRPASVWICTTCRHLLHGLQALDAHHAATGHAGYDQASTPKPPPR